MRRYLLGGWIVALWMMSNPALASDLEQLYRHATQAYQNRQYIRAMRLFERTLQRLQARQKAFQRGTQMWHSWSLGQSDVLYFLAKSALAQKQTPQACARFRHLFHKMSSVPANWRQWGIYQELHTRLRDAQQLRKKHCTELPPKPLPPARPQPLPPPASGITIHKKWWFWTIIGGGIVVGIAIGVAASQSSSSEKLTNPDGTGPFQLWKSTHATP